MFRKLMSFLTASILVSLAIMPVDSVRAYGPVAVLERTISSNMPGAGATVLPPPVSGGVLRFPVADIPTTLDPAQYYWENELVIVLQIFEGLTQLDQNNNAIPAIASSWSSPDAVVWTFNLRNDVYFHNGRQVKAADFVYSWNRARNAGGLYAYLFDDIFSLSTPNDFTLIVTLVAPCATFPVRVTMPVFAVIPSEAASTLGTNPVGAGPFRFVSWTPDKITLQRSPNYYGTPAYLNGIEFKFYADINTEWADFLASNLDISPIPSNQWNAVKSDPNTITGNTMMLQSYGIDVVAYPNVQVRKAFQRAINRATIASNPAVWAYDPQRVANGVVTPGKGSYDNSDIIIPYDPTGALNLLAAAGWIDTNADGILDNGAGANLNVVVQDFASVAGHARSLAIANNLANIGGTGVGAAVTMTANREAATIEQLGWFSDYPAPDNDLTTFYTGGLFATRIHYSSATFDNHVNTALATLNETTRNAEFHAADARLVLDDAALIPLYYGSMVPVLKKPYVYDLLFPAQGYPNIQLKYTWIAFNISGNTGVAGVSVSYIDGTPKTVSADGSGNYSFTVPAGWSGTVTPSRAGFTFVPPSQTYANLSANQSGQNYLASWVGGVKVEADQNVVAVGRPHVGAEVTTYNSFAAGSLSAYVPMLFKDAFGGSYDSALYVQNVNAANTANITIKFYDASGVQTHVLNDTLAPFASKGYWLPGISALGSSWIGGVKVESDQNIVAVGRPHVGSEVLTYNGFASGSLNAYVPMLFKDAFGGSYDSALYVQNVDPSNSANITLKFYDTSGVLTHSLNDTLSPLASKGYWLPGISALGSSWIGGAKVESDVNIVTVGRPHIGTQVLAYDGFASGTLNTYASMLFKDAFGGSYDSALYVQNVHGANTANITIKFYDANGNLTCSQNDTIAPLASKGYWLPGIACLGTSWVGGVKVESNVDIVTVGRPHVGTQVMAYDSFSTGNLNSYVPMLFKDGFGGSYDSALYLQNLDAANTANITIKLYDASGNLACTLTDTLAALASKGYWLPGLLCPP